MSPPARIEFFVVWALKGVPPLEPRSSRYRTRTPNGLLDSAIPMIGFGVLGLVGGIILMTIVSFAHKHSHRYAEFALFAMFLVVPPTVYYFWTSFRQAWRGLLGMLKNLQWYHWLWL